MSSVRLFKSPSSNHTIAERLALLPEKAASEMKTALQDPSTTMLTLANCNLTDTHIPILLSLLSGTKITSLNLRFNNIGNDGAIALAKNTAITSLNLYHNNISPSGIIALAANTAFISLNIGSNDIGDDGVEALLRNYTLLYLTLKDCFFHNHTLETALQEKITNHLTANRKLRTEIRNTAQTLYQLMMQQNKKPHEYGINPLTIQETIQHLLPKDASHSTIIAFNLITLDAIESYKKVKAKTAAAATENSKTTIDQTRKRKRD